ncbi:hypothetical protein A9L43_25110 [Pseudomonas mosselii]|nr:hypothetical protein A9L43_25110 [Pseudomonas mosselii]
MYWLAQVASFMQLVVDNSLIEVICLKAKTLDISLWSLLSFCFVVGPDCLKRLLQQGFSSFHHA